MFGSIESFYEALATGTRKNITVSKTAKGMVGVVGASYIASKAISSGIKTPRTIADKLYPSTTANLGSGKYGIGSGGSPSDVGFAGLKFNFKKKR